ncbi:hypothetical protein PPN31114_02974 [Pandoraea pneumonica]|jgi:hypothetical protein|uniref:Uncharacterized protein n=1 Tax=Pandoraea pneumonica TaxID=2508299 RepID=A0A5E4VY91_9BURK|nr:hypothetical protein [Pandoraea pneumonica]VVE17392.1 hypothetical protein PPN31114_02974 [Pandoraea pneumonica]
MAMGTVPCVTVLSLRNGAGGGGDELFNIEGLPSPDEMRSHNRAGRRASSGCNRSAWVDGWAAVALTTFGLTSLAGAVYITAFGDTFDEKTTNATTNEHLRYIVGGTVAGVSAILIAVGLKHACRCVRARRGEPTGMPEWPTPHIPPVLRSATNDCI